jgi:ribonuclease HI
MKIEAYFDGACEPKNPGGHASWGAVVYLNGGEVWARSGYVGHGPTMSNNVAEYSGLIALLEHLTGSTLFAVITCQVPVTIRGDSKLVVMQMKGLWHVKRGLYTPYYRQAVLLARAFADGALKFEWVPREQNERADELSKDVLVERGVRFRIQPATL